MEMNIKILRNIKRVTSWPDTNLNVYRDYICEPVNKKHCAKRMKKEKEMLNKMCKNKNIKIYT